MLNLHNQNVENRKEDKNTVVASLKENQQVLEDYPDICVYDAAKREPSDPMDWNHALKILKNSSYEI